MNKIFSIVPLVIATSLLVFPFIIYFGNELFVVKSDSMIPTLNPNDLLIVEKKSIDDVKIGDIIVFDSHIPGIDVVAHRTIDIASQGGIIGIQTQGDNVDEKDTWIVHNEDLIGKAIDVVPYLGIILSSIVRYGLTAIVVITGIFLLKEIISETKITNKN